MPCVHLPPADVLVTGANGFVGRAIVARLEASGRRVRAGVRSPQAAAGFDLPVILGDFLEGVDWPRAVAGVSAVVHCAAIAHRAAPETLETVNVEATIALADACAQAGVDRFVFLSSAKAAASECGPKALREADPPTPRDAYGRAKLAAEQRILSLSAIRPVALRPPLVHGAAAKGNFRRLLHLAATGLPLPFADIDNRRSTIALTTLCAAVCRVLDKRDGPSGAFFVADRPALSTPEIVAALRRGLEMPSRLAPSFGLLSRVSALSQLTGSLEIDDTAFESAFGYPERIDAHEALAASAAAWRAAQ